MSRTKRFIGGLSLGYINMALVTLTGLWLTRFLLKRLGQHDYGLWLVGTQMLNYLMLMDFGVVALLPRETAYALGRAGDVHKATNLPELIGQTIRLVIWQIPLVATAALMMWYAMPVGWEALRKPLALVLVAFVLVFPLRIFQAVLEGLQDLSFLGVTQMFSWLLSTALTVAFVFASFGLYSLAIGWVAGQAISTVVWSYRSRHRFPSVFPSHLPRLAWGAAWGYLRRSVWVSVAQIAQALLSATDLVIIARVLGPAAVVPYACTGKLIFTLTNQPQMLMQLASPGLSEMKTGESRERLFQVCTSLTQAMLMFSGAIALVVLLINRGFVGWWVGANQYGGFSLTVLLLASMLLRHWNTTAVYSIFCFGYERRISITTMLDGSATLLASVLLVGRLGPVGAPLGSLIGVCLVSLPANLRPLARESGASIGRLVKPLRAWFWRFMLLFIAAAAMTRVWQPKSFVAVAVTGLAAALLYVGVTLPAMLRTHLGAYLRPRLVLVWARLSGAAYP